MQLKFVFESHVNWKLVHHLIWLRFVYCFSSRGGVTGRGVRRRSLFLFGFSSVFVSPKGRLNLGGRLLHFRVVQVYVGLPSIAASDDQLRRSRRGTSYLTHCTTDSKEWEQRKGKERGVGCERKAREQTFRDNTILGWLKDQVIERLINILVKHLSSQF